MTKYTASSRPQHNNTNNDVGERSLLLPTEQSRRAASGARAKRRSKLWLLPALIFFMIVASIKHLPFAWFEAGWVQQARKVKTELEPSNVVRFRQQGNGVVFGTLDVVEVAGDGPSTLEVDIFTFTYDMSGAEALAIEVSQGEIVLNYNHDSIMPLKVQATLQVRTDKLEELSIFVEYLDINLDIPNADIRKIIIDSPEGSLKLLNPLKSDELVANLRKGGISGSFSLYESLRLATQSGDIDVEITTEEALGTAVTGITTRSGKIQLIFEEILDNHRYETTIESISGGIAGHLPLGDMLIVKSKSGDIDIAVIGTDSKISLLGTENESGHTRVLLGGRSREGVLSSHRSNNGDIELQYAADWEGEIHLKTESGNIEIEGDGVGIIENSGSEIWAKKGSISTGRIMAQVVSGDICLAIG